MVNEGDAFNAAIASTVRAELARRAWTVDDLVARLPKDSISRRTLFRLVDLEPPPDRDMPMWRASYIAAVAAAFGLRPSELVAEVERHQGKPAEETQPLSGVDLRSVIMRYLTNPDEDPELAHRLGEISTRMGLRGVQAKTMSGTIRELRREELERALAALPSKEQGGRRQSG